LQTRVLDKSTGTYLNVELSASPEIVFTGAAAYLQQFRKTGHGEFGWGDTQYVMLPATFLNRGTWLDYE
jgi:hypothetical protein